MSEKENVQKALGQQKVHSKKAKEGALARYCRVEKQKAHPVTRTVTGNTQKFVRVL